MSKKENPPLRFKVCLIIGIVVTLFVISAEFWWPLEYSYATGPNATPEGVAAAVIGLSLLIGSLVLLAWSMGVFKKENNEKSVSILGARDQELEYHHIPKQDETECMMAFTNYFSKNNLLMKVILYPSRKHIEYITSIVNRKKVSKCIALSRKILQQSKKYASI